MGTSPGNIFDQLAAHDSQKITHDQTVPQGNIFDQLAAKSTSAPTAPDTAQRTVAKPGDFEDQQEEAKRLVESGAGPAAAYMKPGQTAAALGGMLAAGGAAGALTGLAGLARASTIPGATKEVGTGILDQYGQEIMKTVQEAATAGPSKLKALSDAVSAAQKAHPFVSNLIEYALRGLGFGAGMKYSGMIKHIGGK